MHSDQLLAPSAKQQKSVLRIWKAQHKSGIHNLGVSILVTGLRWEGKDIPKLLPLFNPRHQESTISIWMGDEGTLTLLKCYVPYVEMSSKRI